MDVSKMFCVLCAFLMVICLALSIATTFVLRYALVETEAWRSRMELPAVSTGLLREEEAEPTLESEGDPEDAPSLDADILYHRFCMRSVGEKIGIFSEEGDLIRTLDVQVKTLPLKDQEALSKGICVNSWRELLSLIRDYE